VRLKDLERHVLGDANRALEWSRHDDIDSSLIPQMYFDYLRGGPAEPLAGIFRHNQMDLRGLAALAGKILTLFDSGNGFPDAAHHSTQDPLDLYGLSRLMQRRGEPARARELYETALQSGLPLDFERLAQRELAQLAKREQDYTRATSLWEDLRQALTPAKRKRHDVTLEDPQKALEAAIEAAEQLAIYYEHRAKQPRRAAELTSHAIAELRSAQCDGGITAPRTQKIEERLSRRLLRLERRCKTVPVPELLRGGTPG
jgi:tetratricopeptide (TPR) repeat protein